ncbi:TetR/AcrR family transcriptional regulator [uncultured Polaribacter sp.]|uniref:TetR/AcrR family transcriptional regulator n=1 Tax=uncultured Polaribacter sp. TaxID=174711 RepID=UPI002612225A|nr:TetR/AcrR family transcriptional regulator [uncultured Polaribacter sp.]
MPKVETFDKEIVINKSLNVFHLKGYNLTSMQDLVNATGLNRSSIYNSFGSKLELYKLCLKSYQESSRNKINENIEASNCAISSLKSIFSLVITSNKEFLKKGCLFNSCISEMANQEASINKILLNNQEYMIALFSGIIEKGQLKKQINTKKSAREYGFYLLTSFQGLRISGIIMNDKNELENNVNTTLSILK